MAENIWQLQEAKNRFSELVNKALIEGPQVVTRRGEEVVVILSRNDYQKIREAQPGLIEYFRASPLVGVDLDLDRDRSLPRDTQL
jgi:antitoxin Phd